MKTHIIATAVASRRNESSNSGLFVLDKLMMILTNQKPLKQKELFDYLAQHIDYRDLPAS